MTKNFLENSINPDVVTAIEFKDTLLCAIGHVVADFLIIIGSCMKTAIFFATVFLTAPAFAQQVNPELISGCATCHGADGIAKFGEVPNLAGQNAPYLVNQLHAFQSGKRAVKEMHYMTRNLTEGEMEAIAAYFSSLPPR